MKILIAVPTKDRYRPTEIVKNTLSWLVYSRFDWKLFVEPQDVKHYLSAIPEHRKNIISLKYNNRGLSYCKREIQRYAESRGYELVFKIDDDIERWRNTGGGKKGTLTQAERTRNIFDVMIDKSIEAFKAISELGGVSLPYGGGKLKTEEIEDWVAVNRRLQTCYIVRTELLCPPRCDEIKVFEDFSTFLYLISRGYITLLYGRTGMDVVPVGKNSGGHQSFNRKRNAELAKDVLSELFPALKWKRVDKVWKWEPDLRFTKLDEIQCLQAKK